MTIIINMSVVSCCYVQQRDHNKEITIETLGLQRFLNVVKNEERVAHIHNTDNISSIFAAFIDSNEDGYLANHQQEEKGLIGNESLTWDEATLSPSKR